MYMCHRNPLSLVPLHSFFTVVAIAKHSDNIWMVELSKVIELSLVTSITLLWRDIMKFLHGDHPIFTVYSLFKGPGKIHKSTQTLTKQLEILLDNSFREPLFCCT